MRDVLLNMLLLTDNAKVGVLAPKRGGQIWIEKWTHMLEEMALRYGPYPAGMDRDVLQSEPFPDFASDLARKAADRLSRLHLRRNDVLIKYGERRHMENLYRAGGLRIQPATFFSHSDHNGAIRDDELTLRIPMVLTRDDIVKVVQNPQDVPVDARDQRLDIVLRHPTDFWLYCVTKSIQPRLFVDFAADACVIIRNPTIFRARLKAASLAALHKVSMEEKPVDYIDPLFPGLNPPRLPFTKNFGYTYQAEYRFCWMPELPINKLNHVDLQLGSLEDIAELICFD